MFEPSPCPTQKGGTCLFFLDFRQKGTSAVSSSAAVVGMAGQHEVEDEYPIGFRFKPKDEELVEYYLVPRLTRQPTVPNDFVTLCDVYTCHPDTLTKEHRGVDQEEWYFLSPRSRMYGNGVRPARKTKDGRGRWKASTASKEVEQKVVCKGITFCRSVLNYFEGVPKKEVRTKWIMLELKVPCFEIKLDKAGPKNMLDEYVVCKIYVSPQHKKKADADEESTSTACEGDEEACQGPAGSVLSSEKQAGKRPMLDKLRPGNLGSSAFAQAMGCSNSNAPRTEVCSGAPPGQPVGAHSSTQAPQMMPQRQAGAFHDQSLRVQQQPTQQTPVLHQSFADARDHHPFGQTTATVTTRHPALENLGVPGNPPRRHPGTAFRPQVSLQCHYDQNYRGLKPPAGNASSSQSQMLSAPASASFLPRQPPPQQLFFNGDGNANHRGAAAAPATYPYQRKSVMSEAAGHDGVANGRNGAPRVNVNDEQYFVDLAMITSNPCLMIGARTHTAPAPARLVESQPPPPPGAVKVETET